MSLEQKILDDLKAAMKARDEVATGALRMIKSQLMLEKTKKGGEKELSDDTVTSVIAAYAKKIQESIDQFGKAGREDLVASHEAEMKIARRYLPEQASEEEVAAVVDEIIAKLGASGPGDLGKVMGPAMGRLKGRADGNVVNRIVRERLQG